MRSGGFQNLRRVSLFLVAAFRGADRGAGYRVCGWSKEARIWARRPGAYGGSAARRPANMAKASRSGQDDGRETAMRVARSVTRAATRISPKRTVSNWASRQNEVFGAR